LLTLHARIDDCLCTGKAAWYVTNEQGQLSLPSLQGRQIECRPAWLGLRLGAFTCVRWQVILCDLIWQVTLRSSEIGLHEEVCTLLTFVNQPRECLIGVLSS